MTKRFFIGYSLITFFLLNSVVLFAQRENAFGAFGTAQCFFCAAM